ncbi:hypothetical protein KA005_29045 [bacterium]|nr:hypothetical protein [bacterium]
MRVTREKITVSLVYLLRSDEADPGYPASKDGSVPTKVYQGSFPLGTENLAEIRAGMLKRLEAMFPISSSNGIHAEFDSAETTKVE